MNNIAILITTFLRDSLLYKTLQNIVDNLPDNCMVLIADQGYNSEEKEITLDYYKSLINLEYYRLPFDCGLSYARNYLVNRAVELEIPYCLLSADSIQFTEKYNFSNIIDLLESDATYGIVGFDLEFSKCPWEYKLNLDNNGFHLIKSNDLITYNSIPYKQVDICRNIFLGKTNTIINLWDDELKLVEHELSFWTYKKRGFKVFWTDTIKFKKINNSNNDEYKEYRNRFKDYQKILKQKLNITNWVNYEK